MGGVFIFHFFLSIFFQMIKMKEMEAYVFAFAEEARERGQ